MRKPADAEWFLITADCDEAVRFLISFQISTKKKKKKNTWTTQVWLKLANFSCTFCLFVLPRRRALTPTSCQRKGRQSGVDSPSGVAGVFSVGQSYLWDERHDLRKKKKKSHTVCFSVSRTVCHHTGACGLIVSEVFCLSALANCTRDIHSFIHSSDNDCAAVRSKAAD